MTGSAAPLNIGRCQSLPAYLSHQSFDSLVFHHYNYDSAVMKTSGEPKVYRDVA